MMSSTESINDLGRSYIKLYFDSMFDNKMTETLRYAICVWEYRQVLSGQIKQYNFFPVRFSLIAEELNDTLSIFFVLNVYSLCFACCWKILFMMRIPYFHSSIVLFM